MDKKQPNAIYDIKNIVMTFFKNTYPIIEIFNNEDLEVQLSLGDIAELDYGNLEKNVEQILIWRIENEFPDYKTIKKKLEKSEFDVFLFSTIVFLLKDELKESLLNFFLDESISLKSIEEKEHNSFSTLLFKLEYCGFEILYFQDIFSVAHLDIPLPSPYFIFGSFFIVDQGKLS